MKFIATLTGRALQCGQRGLTSFFGGWPFLGGADIVGWLN